ncbi:MAG TPA: S8 family serine peptidase, partial [Vicinamibacterales bacterium]|nr:S8 family serine peptidase [Vicinamibacterales bacterium]
MRQRDWSFYHWPSDGSPNLARVAIDECGRFGLLSGRLAVLLNPGVRIDELPQQDVTRSRAAFGTRDCYVIELRNGRSPIAYLAADDVRGKIERSEVEFVRTIPARSEPRRGLAAQLVDLVRAFSIKKSEPHWTKIGVDGSLDGSGVQIGLIDEGFRDDHPSISHAFDAARSMQITCSGACTFSKTVGRFPKPASSHGTQCASLIVSKPEKNGRGPTGLAREATLAAVSIDSDQSPLALAEAVEWLVSIGVDVLSSTVMLNSTTTCNTASLTLEKAVKDAVANGRKGNGAAVIWAIDSASGRLETHVVYGNAGVWPVAALESDWQTRHAGLQGAAMLCVAPGFDWRTA